MNRPMILLFGMPRSGTTWIGKIFDSHPDTLYRHEPDTWDKITEIPLLPDVNNSEQYCLFIQDYVNGFRGINTPQVTAKLPLFRKNYSSSARSVAFRLSVYVSALAGRISRNWLLPTVSPVTDSRSGDVRVTWKSIQLLGRLGVISKCLPNCRVIHILRHPCGYISSILKGESSKKFVSSTPASEDYDLFELLMETDQARKYGLTLEQLQKMIPVERLAWRWVLFNEKAMSDAKNENIFMVRYEDICANPEEITRKMFEFSELTWNEQTQSFLMASTRTNKDAYYSVYKDPVQAANKWRKDLSSNEISLIRSVITGTLPGDLYMDNF